MDQEDDKLLHYTLKRRCMYASDQILTEILPQQLMNSPCVLALLALAWRKLKQQNYAHRVIDIDLSLSVTLLVFVKFTGNGDLFSLRFPRTSGFSHAVFCIICLPVSSNCFFRHIDTGINNKLI